MSERTLIPIFFFWAFLTIITPTLILLSENSKAHFESNGNSTMALKARRMGGCTRNHIRRQPQPPATMVVNAEELAFASAATPPVSPRTTRRATPPPTGSFHNHFLRSNMTDHGLTLSLPNHTPKSNKHISDGQALDDQ